MVHHPSPFPPDPAPGARWLLIALMLACVLPEIVLVAADHGLIGAPRWRPLAYQFGAFWAGLLHGWLPNFAAQPVTMFFTHAFLHTGPMHLLGNMLAFWVLCQFALDHHSPQRIVLIYLVSIFGGSATYGALSTSAVPMVGASGAIFGVAGALLVWRVQAAQGATDPQQAPLPLLAGGIAALIGVNAMMWWLQGGQLAWQTHLGGALTGAGMGVAMAGRQRSS